MSQGAMDGGETNAQGWAVCLKEPWKAVRRMPTDFIHMDDSAAARALQIITGYTNMHV